MNARQYISERIAIEANTGCWLWTGTLTNWGYGRANIKGKRLSAHRVSYEAFVGPIPGKLLACHKCDTKACVNPDHLFLGDWRDNGRDAANKGRLHGQNKTHCKNGHEYTPENTAYPRKDSREKRCRICHRTKQTARYHKKQTT